MRCAVLAVLCLTGPALAQQADLPRLSGIVIAPNYRAAIFETTGGLPSNVQEAERIGPYVIRTIQPAAVWVELDGTAVELVLRSSGPARSVPADTGGVTFGLAVNRQEPAPD